MILAGGSGFLGQDLARVLLAKGCEVVVLTRRPGAGGETGKNETRDLGSYREVEWDGRTVGAWAGLLDGARAVVNLAGRSVNCRHTPQNRREIVDSRVDSVKVIGAAIRKCARPPEAWVQASTLAIYGDLADQWCEEDSPSGTGFPAEVTIAWEKALAEEQTPGTRKVALRIGFVLGRDGGALKVLAKLARLGLGGTTGSGRQYISWIHLDDMSRMFVEAIERGDWEGPFNATGPEPVTNQEFMRELRRAVNRPWSPPAPAWAVRVGAWFMGTEGDLALTGRRCAPRRAMEMGFEFRFPGLRGALEEILGK